MLHGFSAAARRNGVRLTLQFVVTLVLIGVLAHEGYFGQFVRSLRGTEYGWLLLALPFGALSLVSQCTRWWLLLGRAVAWRTVALVVLAAGLIGDFVPLRAGAVFQAQVVHRRFGIARATIAGTLAAEIVLDIIVVAACSIVVIPAIGLPAWLPFVAAALSLGLLIVLILLRRRPVSGVFRPPKAIAALVAAFIHDLSVGFVILDRPADGVSAALLTGGNWILSAVGYYFLGRAFAMDLPLVAFVAMEIAVNIVAKVSPSTANIGTYEVAAQQTLMRFQTPADTAASFAVAAHLTTMLSTIVLGIASAWLLRLRRDDVLYM